MRDFLDHADIQQQAEKALRKAGEYTRSPSTDNALILAVLYTEVQSLMLEGVTKCLVSKNPRP